MKGNTPNPTFVCPEHLCDSADDPYAVEDVLARINGTKKRIDLGRKGRRGEGGLCKLLTKRFGRPFSRVVGSGNRWSQTALSKEAAMVLTGDVVTPPDFRFCLESKHGYEEIDLCSALDGGQGLLDAFLRQAVKDAKRINRLPLMCWNKDRMPWLAFLLTEHLPDHSRYAYRLYYREWIAVALTELLKLPDEFFFFGNPVAVPVR